MTSVLDRPLGLAPQVSVRPERFGALLYHFGTRRLSFLKDRRLLEVLEGLDSSATARAACDGSGVGVKFSTNGLRITHEAARRIAGSDYLDVQISLDGATPEVNDAVRGEGTFATAATTERLTATGQAGVENVLDVLRAGIDSALLGLGRGSIDELTPDDVLMPPGFSVTAGASE